MDKFSVSLDPVKEAEAKKEKKCLKCSETLNSSLLCRNCGLKPLEKKQEEHGEEV